MIDRAEARLQASIMIIISMSESFTGGQVGCMRNTSQPRMDSCASIANVQRTTVPPSRAGKQLYVVVPINIWLLTRICTYISPSANRLILMPLKFMPK